MELGPNGAMIYAMEFLESNMEWLTSKIDKETRVLRTEEGVANIPPYFIFDLPGQVELYTHHDSIKRILEKLVKDHKIHLVITHLTDSLCLVDTSKYISSICLSLVGMMHIELPFIHVSKNLLI